MQRPLQEIDPKIGALRAMGVTDSLTISFRLAFYAGIVLSFPLLLYFLAEFVLPALTAMEKRFVLPAIFVSFALFLTGVLSLLLLASAEDDPLLFSRHGIARLDGRVDRAGILFLRDAFYDRLRPCL